MKAASWLIALGFFCTVPIFAAQFTPPQPLAPNRYDKMVEEWPFALATPAAPPPTEAAPGFAVNLHIMGISRERYPDGKERDTVIVKSQADQTVMRLVGNEPNKEGISVAGVEWSERVGKTKVTLKKGTEFAPLEFDQALVHSAGQAPPPTAAVPRPGVGGLLPQARPVGTPNTSLPTGLPGNGQAINGQVLNGQRIQSRNQPIIPRPNAVAPTSARPQPGAFPQALPGTNPTQPPSSDPRRRERVINSKP